MGLLAFSLQDQVTKYGSYVGIAAFFGLAILSLLYFAQAREVKRLREWAGRAPERAQEVEAMAVQHAEQALRTPTPAPQPARLPEPVQQQPVAAPGNGVVELKPEEIAALAFARAAVVREPHVPHHHAPRPAQPVAASTATATVAAPAAATNGSGEHPAVPAPATAAGGNRPPVSPPRQRVEPLPPRRRSTAPPPRESGARAVIITAIVGVVLLAVAVFIATNVFSNDNSPKKAGTSAAASPTATATAKARSHKAKATPTAAPLSPAQVKVLVYNGTPQTGLAGTMKDQLTQSGTYQAANVGTGNYTPDQAKSASVVLYEHGDKLAAQKVAQALSIKSAVKPVDSTTQTLINSGPSKDWDVVVIVGADRTS
jgi:hypothetical protein